MPKCSICNKDVDNLRHMLICNNFIYGFEDLIPVKYEDLVKFDDYNDHINNCRNFLQNLGFNIDSNDNILNYLNVMILQMN